MFVVCGAFDLDTFFPEIILVGFDIFFIVVRGAFDLDTFFREIILVGLDIQSCYTPLYNGPQNLDTYQVSSNVKKISIS